MSSGRPALQHHLTKGQSWLGALAVLTILGTTAELTILGHYQEPTQILPYAALFVLGWGIRSALRNHSPKVSRRVRVVGAAGILVSVVGAALHYNANLGLARDVDPNISGISYLWAGVHGKIPFLAPLVLAQLSLLVIGSTFVQSPQDSTLETDKKSPLSFVSRREIYYGEGA